MQIWVVESSEVGQKSNTVLIPTKSILADILPTYLNQTAPQSDKSFLRYVGIIRNNVHEVLKVKLLNGEKWPM